MHIKILITILLLEIICNVYAKSPKSNKLIEDICNELHSGKETQLDDEMKHWELICQELIPEKRDEQDLEEPDTINNAESPGDNHLRKGGRPGGARAGSSSRGSGSTIRGGSSIRNPVRIPSVTTFRNTRTGSAITRPNGWLWSRTRILFLPLATRYIFRSSSSSNRYTTPASSSAGYYYCTSNVNPTLEIQCSRGDGDSQCCEDPDTQTAYCCSNDYPDYLKQDPNRAAKTLANVFYTLAAITLTVHLIMRRFYR